MHTQKVEYIVSQIRNVKCSKISLNKKEVSHFVPLPSDARKHSTKIDVSNLNSIINIDPKKKICEAEPGVSFSDLIKETMNYNLVPCTVPELKTITIGGAISGCSIESMSYKYGGFHDSCIEYEIVTGEGKVITCSRKKSQDIFEMLHGSYGTLGIITKIKFKLIEAKPFVQLIHEKHKSFDSYWNSLLKHCKNREYDFIDSIIHKNKFVICLGNFTEKSPYASEYFDSPYYFSTVKKEEDFLTTYDYFFRYDTDCHWITKNFPLLSWSPFRKTIGKTVLGSTNLITWSNRLSKILSLKKRQDIVVDVFLPSRKFPEFYKWYEKVFNYFPLWIVPYKAPIMYPWISKEHSKKMKETFFIDAAVYGKRNSGKIDLSEMLERKVFRLDGIKTLISRNHYEKERFWQIYNKQNYNKVKAITDPHNIFQNFYDKMGRR
ncbi:FAD-binding oxidoreductase [Nanoarchaeota archaeon]